MGEGKHFACMIDGCEEFGRWAFSFPDESGMSECLRLTLCNYHALLQNSVDGAPINNRKVLDHAESRNGDFARELVEAFDLGDRSPQSALVWRLWQFGPNRIQESTIEWLTMGEGPRATRELIRKWAMNGQERGRSHLLVARDTFDGTEFPVYVDGYQEWIDAELQYNDEQRMSHIEEVYCLSSDIEQQLSEVRAYHPPARDSKK